jgi:hypothetical protein
MLVTLNINIVLLNMKIFYVFNNTMKRLEMKRLEMEHETLKCINIEQTGFMQLSDHEGGW